MRRVVGAFLVIEAARVEERAEETAAAGRVGEERAVDRVIDAGELPDCRLR